MNMEREGLHDFVRNRNQALRSGDPEKLRKFMVERKMPVPRSKIAMEVLLHKTTTVSELPRPFKQRSQDWLKKHGYETILDDDNIK
jgi:hypothetical protein